MRELNAAALSAGLTAFVWYACGALPLQLAVTDALGLSSGSVFIVWASGAAASILLSLSLKQPIPIMWSIPALVYLGSLAALVLAGAGSRLMKWLPMPIVMATFAGGLLEYMHRAVAATLADVVIAGSVVGGYFAARLLASPRVPPVGVALAAGCLAIGFQSHIYLGETAWQLPTLVVPEFGFNPAAIGAISVPLVVFALGLGNAQGLGFLVTQGYAVPVDRVSRAVAVGSLVNALFGGTPATVARNAAGLLAGPDAGPAAGRYWGVLLSSVLVLAMACAAVPCAALIAAVPKSLAVSLAGVALVSALQDALEKAFAGKLRLGALVAFIVAATPLSVGGITGSFWALIAGVLASAAARERGLLGLGHPDKGAEDGTHPQTPGPRRTENHGQRHVGHDFRPAERADH